MLGGGLRQAGVLAAAGIVALETMVERLADDHANARRLAEGLAAIPGLEVDLASVQTNMVYVDVSAPGLDAASFVASLAGRGVRVGAVGAARVRLVTHKDVEASGVDVALRAAVLAMP
jgi:threonine aldolase